MTVLSQMGVRNMLGIVHHMVIESSHNYTVLRDNDEIEPNKGILCSEIAAMCD